MLKLSDREWKAFFINEIFKIKGGFYNKKPPLEQHGNIPFLGAVDNSNGITEFYSLHNIEANSKTGKGKNKPLSKKIFDGNCICVTNNGSVGYAYYQTHRFTCSHDVNLLYLKNFTLNKYIALFLIRVIEQQKVCFKYSRKWRPCRMESSKLIFPADKSGNPDYSFMEQYIKERETQLIKKYKVFVNKRIELLERLKLSNREWKAFFINELFECKLAKGDNQAKKLINGNIPLISSGNLKSNGIVKFVNKEADGKSKIFTGGKITVDMFGLALYHQYAFYAVSHGRINILSPKIYINQYIAYFLTKAINTVTLNKYSYNVMCTSDRILKNKIVLPADKSGNPDYSYMEQYIKNLMLQKYH